jgi:hypothetical protein
MTKREALLNLAARYDQLRRETEALAMTMSLSATTRS